MLIKGFIICNNQKIPIEVESDDCLLYFSTVQNYFSTKNVWLSAINFINKIKRLSLSSPWASFHRSDVTKILAFIVLHKTYSVNILTQYYLPPRNVYIASCLQNNNHYQYISASTTSAIAKDLKIIKTLPPVLNGNNYYYVAYYDASNTTINLIDPKNTTNNCINIEKLIQDKYTRIIRDFNRLKGKQNIEGDFCIKELRLDDCIIKVGVAQKLLSTNQINIDLLKNMPNFQDGDKLISNGIYIEKI